MSEVTRKKKTEISEELIFKIAEGSEDAFEELYFLTSGSLYAFLLSLTKNKYDAEDILQDTYIKIRGACHLYKSPGNPMAWIIKIAKNIYLMKLRRDRQRDISYIEDIDYIGDMLFDSINDIENKLLIQHLFKALSSEERTIVILHVLMDMKHKDIAKEMSLPLGTVLSKYHRAMKELKKYSDKEGA